MTDLTPEALDERRRNRTRIGLPNDDTAPELAEPAPEPTSERRHSRGFPIRNVRLPDAEWARVTGEAERTGTTASAVIRDALDAYLDRRP